MSRFTGTLSDLPVADLIQILQLAGRGAVITITRDGLDGRIWCSAGTIVDAESGLLRGDAAVYRILGWEQGSMTADLRSEPRTRSVSAPTPGLLLEAARRKDESVILLRKLGDQQRCFRCPAEAVLSGPERDAEKLALLASFAEPRSLRAALEASALGDFETLTALVRWMDAGLLIDAGTRSEEPSAPATTALARMSPAPGSYSPVAASVGPVSSSRARAPGWRLALGGLAAALLLPGGYLLGARLVDSMERTSAAARPLAAPAPAQYAVELRTEPAQAQVSLDGVVMGVGQLSAVLLRDGGAHELQAVAPGYVPARVLFVDAAPPVLLRLERMPAPSTDENAGEAAVAPEPAPAPAAAALPARPRKAQLARAARREAARAQPAPDVEAAPLVEEPRVQIIEGDAPVENAVN